MGISSTAGKDTGLTPTELTQKNGFSSVMFSGVNLTKWLMLEMFWE
jgi:hypothetical protein